MQRQRRQCGERENRRACALPGLRRRKPQVERNRPSRSTPRANFALIILDVTHESGGVKVAIPGYCAGVAQVVMRHDHLRCGPRPHPYRQPAGSLHSQKPQPAFGPPERARNEAAAARVPFMAHQDNGYRPLPGENARSQIIVFHELRGREPRPCAERGQAASLARAGGCRPAAPRSAASPDKPYLSTCSGSLGLIVRRFAAASRSLISSRCSRTSRFPPRWSCPCAACPRARACRS